MKKRVVHEFIQDRGEKIHTVRYIHDRHMLRKWKWTTSLISRSNSKKRKNISVVNIDTDSEVVLLQDNDTNEMFMEPISTKLISGYIPFMYQDRWNIYVVGDVDFLRLMAYDTSERIVYTLLISDTRNMSNIPVVGPSMQIFTVPIIQSGLYLWHKDGPINELIRTKDGREFSVSQLLSGKQVVDIKPMKVLEINGY